MMRVVAMLALLMLAEVTHATEENVLTDTRVQPGASDTTALVVLLHGYTLGRDSLVDVENATRLVPGLQAADILRPGLPLETFSMTSSSRITAELLSAIDAAWRQRSDAGRPYETVVFIGHSAGALFARKLYAAACGENTSVPFEPELKDALASLNAEDLEHPRPWAKEVDRIILLAGMNRGWAISHHMSLTRAAAMQIGVGIGHVLSAVTGEQPVIFSVRRGSPFITELRLQWLEMRKQVDNELIDGERVGDASVVQLLGTIDDLVSPDDNVDLVSGGDFVYREVPQSGHANVIEMDDSEAGRARRDALLAAFNDVREDEGAPGLIGSLLSKQMDVTDVVFVIHGIRDEGHWTRKIASRVQRALKDKGRVVATETSSYGYFPMLSFLKPGARQQKVEWLMDRYTEAMARYPRVERFHYVGHSNGTYLLAKALEDYPAVRFDQVVFAGSVVRRTYPWRNVIPHRVKAVANFVSTGDWVVAWFPKTLQTLHMQDLGSAGHDGFDAAYEAPALVAQPKQFIVGGHGAAIQESMWDLIADFIATGKLQEPPAALQSTRQVWWIKGLGLFPPLVWLAITGMLLAGLVGLLRLRIREWKKTMLIVAYATLIWTVLTRV
jgi:pimeloyl-ACP methyl ester carboxylesterase